MSFTTGRRRVLQLLRTVRAALVADPADGAHKRLLIIEYVLTEGPSLAAWLDLNFLVLVDGRERTLDEYRALGARAGWCSRRRFPRRSGGTFWSSRRIRNRTKCRGSGLSLLKELADLRDFDPRGSAVHA